MSVIEKWIRKEITECSVDIKIKRVWTNKQGIKVEYKILKVIQVLKNLDTN